MKTTFKNFPESHETKYIVNIQEARNQIDLMNEWKDAIISELREMKTNLEKMHKQYPLSADSFLLELLNGILGENQA